MGAKSGKGNVRPLKLLPLFFLNELCGTTVFLGGLLLFSVQPMLAKYILPWFGGSASTWIVCLAFFQGALLIGYLYAYLISARLGLKTQVATQVVLICVALILLPITPQGGLEPVDASAPVSGILRILTVAIGLPYVVLATTSPLLQCWLSLSASSINVTRYFAISNLGSFLGLLIFPLVLEPSLSNASQTYYWSGAFLVFGGCFALSGICVVATASAGPIEHNERSNYIVGWPEFLTWLGWAALGVALLLATSNFITESTIIVPFLWIIPLGLYLLSFVIVFNWPRAYRRLILSLAFMLLTALTLQFSKPLSSWVLIAQIAILSVCMFVGCIICHGEIAARQPHSAHLPTFYLIIAAGGVVGGVFVSMIAPMIFNDTWEYPIIAVLIGGSAAYVERTRLKNSNKKIAKAVLYGSTLVYCAAVAVYIISRSTKSVIWQERNFYGVVKIIQTDPDDDHQRQLVLYQSGEDQGEQYESENLKTLPSCDFSEQSALGVALKNVQARRAGGTLAPVRVGVVGMGAGMISALAKSGDMFRFYEINPAVVYASTTYFSFLRSSKALKLDVVLGDGRLELDRDARRGEPKYDLLIIDAYRGASPPMHLMTKEAYEVYLSMLAPSGVLAVDLDLDNFDLSPVHRGLSSALGLPVGWFDTPSMIGDCDDGVSWALYSRDAGFWNAPDVKDNVSAWPDNSTRSIIWTDQKSNLLSVIAF